MKISDLFLSKNFPFLIVSFPIYLNKRVRNVVYFKRKEFVPKWRKVFPFRVDLLSERKENNFD